MKIWEHIGKYRKIWETTDLTWRCEAIGTLSNLIGDVTSSFFVFSYNRVLKPEHIKPYCQKKTLELKCIDNPCIPEYWEACSIPSLYPNDNQTTR